MPARHSPIQTPATKGSTILAQRTSKAHRGLLLCSNFVLFAGSFSGIFGPLSAAAGPIYELGSGWGTLAFALADHFPRCQVIACELSPLPYLVSRLRQRWSPRTNLVLRREDFLKLSLTSAAAVVCYLCPPLMQELGRKLVAECRPNTLVVSNTFSIHSWMADQVHRLGDLYDSRVYVYRVPAIQPRMSASTGQ